MPPYAIRAENLTRAFGPLRAVDRLSIEVPLRQLLTHLGLWERRKETVGAWSRGMKQKLAVARALLHRPALILTQ